MVNISVQLNLKSFGSTYTEKQCSLTMKKFFLNTFLNYFSLKLEINLNYQFRIQSKYHFSMCSKIINLSKSFIYLFINICIEKAWKNSYQTIKWLSMGREVALDKREKVKGISVFFLDICNCLLFLIKIAYLCVTY